MKLRSIPRLTDFVLARTLRERTKRETVATVFVVALIAEFDARKLYLPAGYPSMHAYCVQELGLSDDAAFKRIRVARKTRQFPALLREIATGRLTLSAAVMIAPHLTEDAAAGLIADALGKTNDQIRLLLAERFPQADVPTRIVAVKTVAAALAPGPVIELAARPVGPASETPEGPVIELAARPVESAAGQSTDGPVIELAVRPVEAPRPRVTPLAPQRFALHLTMPQTTHDKLRYAQSLLSHRVAPGDVAQVLDRALDALIAQLEKEKFGATTRPQANPRESHSRRHIPASVKREVYIRDQGRCTFVSESGRRCDARDHVEFDHIQEVARGGEATVDGIRLRCRPHNQYTAERTFGVEFMQRKRDEATGRHTTGAGMSP